MSIADLPIYRSHEKSAFNKKQRLLLGLFGLALCVVVAYLVVADMWMFAVVMVAALPIFVLLHRYPLTGLFVWLLLGEFLVATNGGTIRKMYWLIHRALPLITLGIIFLSYMLRIHKRRLPRLGGAELLMAGYLVVTQLSVIYLSNDVMANSFYVYDRIFVPMCLYLLVRLMRPSEQDMRRLIPFLIFILIAQSVIGIASWTVPQVLPSAWLDRVGTRTTGSLQSYSVFTCTAVTCGLLILQSALNHDLSNRRRRFYYVLFALSYFMIFFSFSRGSWLAGLVVFMGLGLIYRQFIVRFTLAVVPLVAILLTVGLLSTYTEWASQRFYSDRSEEAALSRLPIYYASYRMFEEKPLLGWGYGNFDHFDRLFQERVSGLINAVKDHASHNLYLTIVAEQGIVGIFFYLMPMFWWLALSIKAYSKLPAEGFWSRKLLVIFWLLLLFHIIVNNFSNMRVVYGLGLWWITLGFIAVMVSQSMLSEQNEPEAYS
jgi:O-antigen ligase